MLWVIWDIFIPVISAFLAGLFIGWLLWRWRRSRFDANAVGALRRAAARHRKDADNLRVRNAELADKLQVASGTDQQSAPLSTQEIERAKKRIEVLSSELKSSRQQIDKLRKDNAQAGGLNRVRELEARLHGAQRRIADLEKKQTPTAEVELADSDDLQEALRVRDQMITTLRASLEQFGESEDNTALKATLALRDRKIETLERQLLELKSE